MEIITIDPNIRFGKPHITGTRITVEDVKRWTESGMSVEDIRHEFPELTEAQIKAALSYEG